jgi:HEAT repeat protein
MNLALIASAWIIVASVVSAAQAGQSQRQFTEQLTHTIAKVRTGNSPLVRTEAAEHLAELTSKTDSRKLDDKTVADLVSLLDTSDDSVVYWVARCLGNLGSRANTAIPKLQKKLLEVDCVEGSKTSASGIRFALSQLDAPPAPSKCVPIPKPQ